ncbi:MAG: hypothetical protein K2K63_02665 [Acetatifactor sp.]|nr:hypothetical protein [Acetatifactor sp.]
MKSYDLGKYFLSLLLLTADAISEHEKVVLRHNMKKEPAQLLSLVLSFTHLIFTAILIHYFAKVPTFAAVLQFFFKILLIEPP